MTATDVTLGSVRIKNGVKTENVQLQKRSGIVMSAVSNAKKDCWRKSSPMPLPNLPDGMGKSVFWIVWKEMRKKESYIIGKA